MSDLGIERDNLINNSELMQTGKKLQASHRFLQIANRHAEMMPLLDEFIAEIRTLSGCAAVNTNCGPLLHLPEPLIRDDVLTIPGLDGRKMSKNYGNTIPIFAEPEAIHKRVMRIKTDSKRPEDPKNQEACNVFAIYRHVAPVAAVAAIRRLYEHGGLAYSVIKEELAAKLEEMFGPLRPANKTLFSGRRRIDRILTEGAVKARRIAAPVINNIRNRIGIRR